MKEICLYNLEQVGVIILDPNGAIYFNKSGGTACMQSRERGFFVPISNDPPLDQPELNLPDRLTAITRDLVGLSGKHTQPINELLLEISSSDTYSVNEDKLSVSHEAWVYIKVIAGGNYSQFEGFGEFYAVLTWPNSD
ncbi:MAG: hypothetical protein JKY67_21200 [Pseudomonadales bacterium]|nr:hypothetical protein [Pseudomonadales bacterium]